MSKVSTAELQFGLAVIGRARAAAKALVWKRSSHDRVWCETEGFRLTLSSDNATIGLHLCMEGADAEPVFSLSAAVVAATERRYVEEALAELHNLASERAEPVRPTLAYVADKVFVTPLDPVEEARLAGLVRRLGQPRAPEAPRRRWFTAPRWGVTPDVVPLTGQA